ncbi:MAG: HEAT repeat domain-containing protein [Oligoflexia bacterium]|nr:HEAT repeat domain-containing protein [Oligoflexia bacterium]
MKANLLKNLSSLCPKISKAYIVSLILCPNLLFPAVIKGGSQNDIHAMLDNYRGYALLKKLCADEKRFGEIVSLSKKNELKDTKRWALIMAMTKMGGAAVVPELKTILKQKGSSWYIRSAVATSLGVIRDENSLELLHNMMRDSSLVVRTMVVKSVGDIGNKKSLPYLVRELKSDRNFHKGQSLWIRKHLVDAIARCGGKKAIPVLISYLDDTDKAVALNSKNGLLSLVHNANIEWSKRNWIDWWKENQSSRDKSG